MVELSGSLGGADLMPMVRLLSELRQTGSLQLSRPMWAARLDLHDGRIVGASFAAERGERALTALGLVMDRAEFAYVEGPAPPTADLDLTPERLQSHFDDPASRGILALDAVPRAPTAVLHEVLPDRQVSLQHETIRLLLQIDGRRTLGEIVGPQPSLAVLVDVARLVQFGLIELATPPNAVVSDRAELRALDSPTAGGAVCPKLGFADNPISHYTRPTAVHRCYASGSQQLVSTLEQREYCLSDRYGACPRFRPPVDVPDQTPVAAAAPDVISTEPDSPLRRPRTIAEVLLPTVAIALTVAAIVAVSMTFLRPPAQLGGVEPTLTTQAAPTTALPISAAQPAPTPARATATAIPPLPTVAPTAVPTRAAAPPVRAPDLLNVSFVNAQLGWIENPPVAGWSAGAYRLAAHNPGQFVAVNAPVPDLPANVELTATFRKVGGPAGGGFGFILRDQEPALRDGTNQTGHFYVVEVGDRGQVGMWRHDDDHWVDVLPWTNSNAVRKASAANELTVRAIGSRFTMIVNGAELPTLDDASFVSGGVGMFVGGDGNEVAVDRFSVRAPAKPAD